MGVIRKLHDNNPLQLRKLKKEVHELKLALNHERVTREQRDIDLYKNQYEFGRFYDYQKWYATHYPSNKMLDRQRTESAGFAYRPLISIILPVYKTPVELLEECLDSVVNQSYDNWELCVVDDHSQDAALTKALTAYQKRLGKKLKLKTRKTNGHIAQASNDALGLAAGEYCALLDHDDLLWPNALYEMAKALNNDPAIDFLYTDEDKFEDGVHNHPFFKPDFSKYFLLSCNYITHFAVIRTRLLQKVGGFRPGYDGAQDWDLFLRLATETARIHHINTVAYTWRVLPSSTAGDHLATKPYVIKAQRDALESYLAATHVPYSSIVENKQRNGWRINFTCAPSLVSIIIPTKDCYEYIQKCVKSILKKSTYEKYEIVIVDTGSTDPKVAEFYKTLPRQHANVRIVSFVESKFNFSNACNEGARHAKGDYYLFLNNDTEVIAPDWLEAMLGYASQPDVGAVGAKLFYGDGTIQHAGGLLTPRNIGNHALIHTRTGTNQRDDMYGNNARECSFVTAACMMVSKQKFDEVKGFDASLRVTFNDVDFCLRLRAKGYLNIYTPYAELYHYESVSVGKINTSERDANEVAVAAAAMKKRWAQFMENDPYMNKNFKVEDGTVTKLEV